MKVVLKFIEIIIIIKLTSQREDSIKPTIGIVSNPTPENSDSTTESKIYLTYTLYAEVLGARVVPILYDYSEVKLVNLISKLDGIIFQGGNRDLHKGKYESQSQLIIDIANKNKIPILFICQGFELLHYLLSNDIKILEPFDAWAISLPSEINEKEVINSKLFKYFDANDFERFKDTNLPATMYFHNLGISPEAYVKYSNVSDSLVITSFGNDKNNKKFVNTFESKDFSKNKYFGVQFHPEKIGYTKSETEFNLININTRIISNLIGVGFINEVVNHHIDFGTNFTEKEHEIYGLMISNEISLCKEGKFYIFDSANIKLVPSNICNNELNEGKGYITIIKLLTLVAITVFLFLYFRKKVYQSEINTRRSTNLEIL